MPTKTEVTGTLRDSSGAILTSVTGSISFVNDGILNDTTDKALVIPVPVVIPIESGQFSVSLFSTDNTDLHDANGVTGAWRYNVQLKLNGMTTASWRMALPYSATPVDISGLMEAAV